MVCKNCNSFIDENAKFCMFCGTKTIKKICSNCGSVMPEIAIFCSECGQQLSDNSLSDSSNMQETTGIEEEYGYEDYDEYDEDEYDEEEDYEESSDDEYIDESSEYTNNTNIPTLSNYKDLGIGFPQSCGYQKNFRVSPINPNPEDLYSYIDHWNHNFEKCNLYNIYYYIINIDGIFYATRNEVVFLHKSGRRFNINIENVCGLEFMNNILTITYMVSNQRAEWGTYDVFVEQRKFEYSYILNNMS